MDPSRRKELVAKAFNNNHELQEFIIADVAPTGKTLGSGSFGSVLEVSGKT